MASNRNNNRQQSEVRRPQPKRRKTAIPTLLPDEPVDLETPLGIHIPKQKQRLPDVRPQGAQKEEGPTFRMPATPVRHGGGPSRAPLTGTPVRPAAQTSQTQDNRVPSITASASRIVATPARPQPRISQEHLGMKDTRKPVTPRQSRVQPRTRVLPTMSIGTNVATSSSGSKPRNEAARKPGVSLKHPASESEDSANEVFVPQVHRAARKSRAQVARKEVASQRSRSNQISLIDSDLFENNDDDDEGDLYVNSGPEDIQHRAERLRDGDSSDDDERVAVTHEDMEKELNDVLAALSIREVKLHMRRRLPFLRRNLRKSMDALGPAKWREHDPNVVRFTKISKVNLVYVIVDYESPGGSFSGKWFCPLCAVRMWFETRGALDTHLYSYHTQCGYEWEAGADNSLTLRITVPEVPDSDTESEGDGFEDSELEREESPEEEQDSQGALRSSPPPDEKPFLRGSSVARTLAAPFSSPVKIQPVSPQLSPIRPGKEKEAGPSGVLRPPRPIDPTNPDRYPTPPPLDNLEGPAAVYPYISEDTYSARPGGPKLYDLLNELSLEPFGLMTWYIIDREEDIFELDHMRDEDKVMLALWGRWIFLNRPKFIEDYEKGIKLFIDEYWRMIHRAAGFAALRTWLLVLVQNRFLTGQQFCDALRYYIDLVGMDHWDEAKRQMK